MTIAVILFLLSGVAFWSGIVGLIKPSLVIRWGNLRTRKTVLAYYGIPWLVFLVLWVFSIPPSASKAVLSSSQRNSVATKNNSQTASVKSNPAASNGVAGDVIAGDEAKVSAKDGGFLAFKKSDYTEWWNDITADNTTDMQSLLNQGVIVQLDNGTQVYVKSLSWNGTAFVRIDHLGVFTGQTGYISSDELVPIK